MSSYIKFDNIYKSFDDNEVLRGVTLELDKNESVVVIGASGCGKSVLLKHLNRLIEPDSGKVIVDNQDIAKLNSNQMVDVRRDIGMLFQSAALLDSLTVGENVGLALKEILHYKKSEIDEIVEQKLGMVGLSGKADLFPSDLSGGMRKRVGLARAIATEPKIILYDEPTTGLDPIMADIINDLILELHNKLKVTSITVTHDMISAYKVGQRIVMLYQGKVEFDGTPEEVKSSGNKIVNQFIHGRADGPIQN
ncbi:MAG: ABC transporter ATP-binding protein [Candidatus Zixiibacteriota bacterium]